MGCCQTLNTDTRNSQRVVVNNLTKLYEIDPKVLGAGSFGKVFLAHNKKNRDFRVAVKVISKIKFANELEFIRQEVQILSELDHPNIVKYYRHIPIKAPNSERIQKVCIVTEFIRGQTLHDFIVSNEKID